MIFDCETDGLLDEATKIHVLTYQDKGGNLVSLTDYDDMRSFLLQAKTLIGHDIIRYDIPVLEKILGIEVKARLICTLSLSWYLNHKRKIHGLDSYGKDFGVPKPKVDDWVGAPIATYIHRCEEDVKINNLLWKKLRSKLLRLYDDKSKADELITYLSFKMDCLREQAQSKWELDVDLCEQTIALISPMLEDKKAQLIEVMPPVVKTKMQDKPAKPYKKDGTLSVTGARWQHLLKKHGYDKDEKGPIEIPLPPEEPNPNSPQQIKDWLFSLGWEPETFKYEKNDDGTERAIPQVRVDTDEGKALCPSVVALIHKHNTVGILEGYTVLVHRLSILQNFLADSKDGKITAEAGGFTNTLRLKHRVLVNLPGVGRDWGKQIRGCLKAPEGYELCGSDMSSLEDNTKRHYMYPYDPDFVNSMSDPSFDPHLDLALFAGRLTEEEVAAYVAKDPQVQAELKGVRYQYKTANYSATYGVGAAKLARTLGISLNEAKKLLEVYWKRNWAITALCEDIEIKTIGSEMWLLNPVSGFYYSLRYKKDVFSTLNQGTGVYCFDLWLMNIREKRPQLTGQFHDEIILCIKKGNRDVCRNLLNEAISKVNEKLKLNVTLSVDIQFGDNYAEIH